MFLFFTAYEEYPLKNPSGQKGGGKSHLKSKFLYWPIISRAVKVVPHVERQKCTQQQQFHTTLRTFNEDTSHNEALRPFTYKLP